MNKLDEVLAQGFQPHMFMLGIPWNGLESARQVHLLGVASFPDMAVNIKAKLLTIISAIGLDCDKDLR